jgi:hypothetical protein
MTTRLDNDQGEPIIRRSSVPLVRYIDGHWCWLRPGTNRYEPEPELERVLLAALEHQGLREAA